MRSLVYRARRHLPLGLAVLALVALLLALQSVLQQSVQRGHTQRKAAASQADTQWRCGVLRGKPQREQCQTTAAATP